MNYMSNSGATNKGQLVSLWRATSTGLGFVAAGIGLIVWGLVAWLPGQVHCDGGDVIKPGQSCVSDYGRKIRTYDEVKANQGFPWTFLASTGAGAVLIVAGGAAALKDVRKTLQADRPT